MQNQELYDLLQQIIDQGDIQAISSLTQRLRSNPGKPSKQFGCGENTFYALKRLVTASMAKDLKIKANCRVALRQLQQNAENLKHMNNDNFVDFFLSTSNHKKHCEGKKPEINGYIQGKIDVINIMHTHFLNSEKVTDDLIKLAQEFDSFEEQIVEVFSRIAQNQQQRTKFEKDLSLTKPSAITLRQIILGPKGVQVDQLNELIETAVQSYPKESIPLKFCGINLSQIHKTPSEFFKEKYSGYLDSGENEEPSDMRVLFYLLQIQKYFLESTSVTRKNMSKILNAQMVKIWMEQLRVKNKHMKNLASSMTIKFEKDENLALSILTWLHTQNIYLENVSNNHPFANLYQNVNASKYWDALHGYLKTQAQSKQMEDQESIDKTEEILSQLQYFARQRYGELGNQKNGETLTTLIAAFHKSPKSEKLLNLVWSFCHHVYIQSKSKKNNKKKFVLETQALNLLAKVKVEQLEIETEVQEAISRTIQFISTQVKGNKDTSNKVVIAFLNFSISLLFYSIVYPQESDICRQIEFISKDLETYLTNYSKGLSGTPKKKRKRSESVSQEDPKKAVHVLIEVLVSLLTKAPVFLRNSINLIFEQLVPHIESSDLQILLDVIQKPDQEYIEEI